MKFGFSAAALMASAMLFSAGAVGAQVVDGDLSDLGTALTVQTEAPSFGASMYVDAIYLKDTPNNVYIGIEGDSSFNNHFIVLIDVASRTGDSAAPVPSSSSAGALSGGDFVGSTLELPQVDFGFSGNSGDNNNSTNGGGNDASFYLDFLDYTTAGNTGSFQGTDAVVDNGTDASQIVAASGIVFAYSDNDTSGTGGNQQGLEIMIPKTVLGITGGTSIQIFAALTGGSGFFSSSVLPPVTGRGAVNIGVDPNFTTLAGTQATTASAISPASVSEWMTLSD